MTNELKDICQEILDNEDSAGCDRTLTVTSRKACQKLRKLMKEVKEKEKEEKRKEELKDLRNVMAENTWDASDLDGLECIECENWEIDGDMMLRKFYYEGKSKTYPDEIESATFVIVFKKNSDYIKDTHINT